jgi:hypothetical protein
MSNWRDDNRERAAHEEHEASERAMGHRETAPPPHSLDSDVRPGRELPEFIHTPAAERAPVIRIHTAPAEPAQPPETRMSIAQLRDRISGMEATTRMKATEATEAAAHHYYPGEKRPRVEGPCARNERTDKLTRYRAELATREAAEPRATPTGILEARAAEDRAHQRAADEYAAAIASSQDARGAAAGELGAITNPTPATAAACRAMQREATAAELPPVPPAAAAALERASSKRAAVVATAQADSQAAGGLTELDRAVEQLVRAHSSGAVIDAAWSASARIFRPQAGAR